MTRREVQFMEEDLKERRRMEQARQNRETDHNNQNKGPVSLSKPLKQQEPSNSPTKTAINGQRMNEIYNRPPTRIRRHEDASVTKFDVCKR